MNMDDPGMGREDEANRIINEEYKTWKKNSPFLYDLIVTHALEWPSLTCQWFPDVERVPDQGYMVQRLLLGTHTNDDEPNYLQIASVCLPDDEKDFDVESYEKNFSEKSHIKITQKICHKGEVNRARYHFENPNIIATKSKHGEVFLFDRTTFDAMPKKDEKCRPTRRLKGHEKEGYGLAWNPHSTKYSHLLSAGFDGKVCLWDIAGNSQDSNELEPLRTFEEHTSGVEDVAWHSTSPSIFASVGDDKKLIIWDTGAEKPVHNIKAHDAEVNCVAFCPGDDHVFATGSGDKTAALWDMRNLKEKLKTLQKHDGEILQLAWSPHHQGVLATASSDRRILVWDPARSGGDADPEDGPPELLFMHGGHTSKISDFGWNPHTPWMLASTAEDNIVQVWQTESSINSYREEDEKTEE